MKTHGRRTLLAMMLVATSVAASGQASPPFDPARQTPERIIAQAEGIHPAGLYVLAAKLMGEGRWDEAVRWFYIGQLRYRFLLASAPADAAAEQPLFSALSDSVGRPINEYAFGDIDDAVAQIDAALAWDEAHPNRFTPKDKHPEALAEVRAGLRKLRDDMLARRDEIRNTRTRNGLENR